MLFLWLNVAVSNKIKGKLGGESNLQKKSDNKSTSKSILNEV